MKNLEFEKFEKFLKEKDYPLINELFSNIFESQTEKNDEYGMRLWNYMVSLHNKKENLVFIATGEVNLYAIKVGKAYQDCKMLDKAREFYEYVENNLIVSSRKIDKYCYSLLNICKSQLLCMENCATAFILAKKAIESQYMNDLSCMQGFEILDGLLENAKITKSKDSLEWYKIALDALIKIKKVQDSVFKRQKVVILMEMSRIYLELLEYDNAENMLILVFEQDPGNLEAFRLLLQIICNRMGMDLDHERVKDVFVKMIQNQKDLKSDASMGHLMSMIYMVATKISSELAMECVELLRPELWKNKNVSHDSFVVAKLYLLTLEQKDVDETKFLAQFHELNRLFDINDSVKSSCQSILIQAGDRKANEQKWKDSAFYYNQSLLNFDTSKLDVKYLANVQTKLAACYLKIKDFDLAEESVKKALELDINPCGMTLIVLFLVCMEKGLADLALQTLDKISDLKDPQLLIYAAECSYNNGNKLLVKQILKIFVVSDVEWDSAENQRNLFVFFRCLIRLNEAEIFEADSIEKKSELADENLKYFSKILKLVSKWFSDPSKMTEEVSKEIDWLIQSCWNQAIDFQTQSIEMTACVLFEYTAQLISVKNSSEYLDYIHICYYFSIKYRVKLARSDKTKTEEHVQIAGQSHQSLSLLMTSLKAKLTGKEINDLVSYLFLSNLEMEILNENWEKVAQILESTDLTAFPIPLLKCMADKVALDYDPPSGIVYLTLKNTMSSIMKKDDNFDLVKFAQWFRLLIQTSAISNETITIEHLNQAIQLIKSFPYSQRGGYPMVEIEWLTITSWNIGMRLEKLGKEECSVFLAKSVELSRFLPCEIIPEPISTYALEILPN